MSVVLQVSDTHFGTEKQQVVDALVAFGRALAPDLLVLSGDITQRARASQFLAARQFVDAVNARAALVVPGNHDIPLFNVVARVFRPYGNHRRQFGTALEGEYEADDLLVIALNTTRAHRHKHGEVSSRQIEATARRLRRSRPEQLRVVVTHQPLHVTRPRDESNLLRGHAEAAQSWASAGGDLLLAGHIHLPYVRPVSERLYGLEREIWAANAGTATSDRVRDGLPNSVNVIRSGTDAPQEGHFAVERHDYREGSFERNSVHVIPVLR